MSKKTYWFTVAIALLTLVAELSAPMVIRSVTYPFGANSLFNYAPFTASGLSVLRVLFIILPPLAVIAALRAKQWSLYCAMAFAFVAAAFMVSLIPFLATLAPPTFLGAVWTVLIPNACLVAVAAWVRWGPSNCSFKRTPKPLRGSGAA